MQKDIFNHCRNQIFLMQKSKYKLSKENILKALQALSDYFKEQDSQGEICIFRGTVMLLAFDAREMTRDVDAVFRPSTLFRDAAKKLARRYNCRNIGSMMV